MAERSGYSSSQIMAMQRDAIRRVNEMQRISQEKLRQTEAAFGGRVDPPAPASPPAAAQAAQAMPSSPAHPEREEQSPVQERRMPGGMGMENNSYGVNRQGHPGGQGPNAVPIRHMGGGNRPAPPPEVPPPPLEEVPAEELPEGALPPAEAGQTEIVPAGGLQGILQRMNLDSETVMLLMLLLLLVNEGADVMLIMALVYILL